MYPVATWKQHDITKLPICWLFSEYDREGECIAFIYDGETHRLYEGNLATGLLLIEKVQVYGRRWDEREETDYPERFDLDDACGVKLIIMEDGLCGSAMLIGANQISISTWGMRRRDTNQLVEGLFVDIKHYHIDITPEAIAISVR